METNNKPNVNDLLGLAPYGESLKLVIEKGFDAASAVLSRICLPAAEELGLMYRDKIKFWRLKNIIKIIDKSKNKIDFLDSELQLSLHPRIANELLEHGSLCDDDKLQEMWSGLLFVSIEIGESNDQNLLFANALKQLTAIQARLINHVCQNCKVKVCGNGLLIGGKMKMDLLEITNITGCSDIHQLDAELDSLRTSNLILGGFSMSKDPIEAELRVSAFLLALYSKTQGYKGQLLDFYSNQIADGDDPDFRVQSYLVSN
ncbi:hypothetical protein [Pedobacter sp. FW305-3-2-15-E-R2A2]|uniref:Abi-alpha family protein n=1 Tax=Pedobacter sp. FW305-3-2-15-E-R2A2 TaxID=3140251 RepID=UPI0031400ECE